MSRKCKAWSEFGRDNPKHQNPLSKEAFAAGWNACAIAATDDALSVNYITDNHGSYWSKTCPQCGQDTMEVVRPGKAQCGRCG